MKLSIIIPTHNRADILQGALASIVNQNKDDDYEIVVVDNNSKDNTKEVVAEYSDPVRYIFEENTSFTAARRTGTENAKGDILVYIDDDVLLHENSIEAAKEVFKNYPDCGVIAGRIIPKYEEPPPDWTLSCQQQFNGWSLLYPKVDPKLGSGMQEVDWAAGPLMAVSRKAFDEVEGFPPDTIGVETNLDVGEFRKLYIGPGDYGLCEKIRKKGFKVIYSPELSCFHRILKTRLTIPFWRSRTIGEGHHLSITNREFFNWSKKKLKTHRKLVKDSFVNWKNKLIDRLEKTETYLARTGFNGMLFEELWVHYNRAYLRMDRILSEHEGLSAMLWELGLNGIPDNRFDDVVCKLPPEYLEETSSDHMYAAKPIKSIQTFRSFNFSI